MWFRALSLRVPGLATIEQRNVLADVTTPRPGADGIESKSYTKTFGQETVFNTFPTCL